MDFSSLSSNLFYVLLLLATFIGIFATLAGFFGRKAWILDLFSHFRLQYFLALGICSLLFLPGAHYLAALVSGSTALVNLALILPDSLPSPRVQSSPAHYRVMFCNVLQENRQHDKVVKFIEQEDPDMIVLVEVDQEWIEGLKRLSSGYPYCYTAAVQDDHFGLAFFSRIPFDQAEICHFGKADVPTIVVRLFLEGHNLTVIGTHPYPPKRRGWSQRRDKQLMAIVEFAAKQIGEVMVMGDLNLSPWSPFFKQLLHAGNLRDSRRGYGLQVTWPADLPIFLTPIDHILVTPGIVVDRREVGPYIGSDHYPIWMDFSFRQLDRV